MPFLHFVPPLDDQPALTPLQKAFLQREERREAERAAKNRPSRAPSRFDHAPPGTVFRDGLPVTR